MIEFYSITNKKRPVRLKEATRLFAFESLNYKYGQDALKTPCISMHDICGYENMSDLEKYDIAIRSIAQKAPVRICENEMLSGAATLSDAILHRVPVHHDKVFYGVLWGISHLTVDFFEVLKIGMNGIQKKVEKALEHQTDSERKRFLKSCINSIESMRIWHGRYIEALENKKGYENNLNNLKRVPFEAPQSFYEAVQTIWFCFAFMRLCGCWPGIGRIDVLLGDFLKKDLENKVITLEDAREILAHFFIKGCEWITGEEKTRGDAEHYQNIVLAGIDENGKEITNEVTYLVLDIIEETGISDYPVTVRINKNSDELLLKRVAEVISYGGGTIAVYNEDLVLDSLKNMGYSGSEAASFANDGCWEVQIPGKTFFSYEPFDSLAVLEHITLKDYNKCDFADFNEILRQYKLDLKEQVALIFKNRVTDRFADDTYLKQVAGHPCSVVSLFEHDCIENGISYNEGGTRYNVISPHIGGVVDLVNSLYAIKKVVFDDKLLSLSEFFDVVKNNWENQEPLRKKVLNNYKYFGNDNDEVDLLAADILDSFSDMCLEYDNKTYFRFVSGVSTFGRQIGWAEDRLASLFGRKKGEILSGNFSPTPGTDNFGAGAIIKSCCKANLKKQYTGAATDISLLASDMEHENAIPAICGLIKGFCVLGGYFLQIDVADSKVLLEAQKNPSLYQNLSVRVSGWNARFVTMSREWQNMIIERSKK